MKKRKPPTLSPQQIEARRQRMIARNKASCAPVPMDELVRIVNEAKLNLDETAKFFGVSTPTITRRMREFGLRSKKGRGSPMEKNYFWRGGKMIDADGYVLLKSPGHPFATKAGYVHEHRLVMEKQIGRYLDPKEVVHHRNRQQRQNNSPGNLRLFSSNADHLRHELTGRTPNFSPDGLRRIRENTRLVNLRRSLSTQKAKESDAAQSQ